MLDVGQLPEGFPTLGLHGLGRVDPHQVRQLRKELSPLEKNNRKRNKVEKLNEKPERNEFQDRSTDQLRQHSENVIFEEKSKRKSCVVKCKLSCSCVRNKNKTKERWIGHFQTRLESRRQKSGPRPRKQKPNSEDDELLGRFGNNL